MLVSAEKGYTKIFKFLIEKAKADPNKADSYGYTSLLVASQYGRLDILKYLVEEVKIDLS